jgi:hypothetical protein
MVSLRRCQAPRYLILRARPPPSRTVADWLAIQLDGDQPEQWLRSTLLPHSSP